MPQIYGFSPRDTHFSQLEFGYQTPEGEEVAKTTESIDKKKKA